MKNLTDGINTANSYQKHGGEKVLEILKDLFLGREPRTAAVEQSEEQNRRSKWHFNENLFKTSILVWIFFVFFVYFNSIKKRDPFSKHSKFPPKPAEHLNNCEQKRIRTRILKFIIREVVLLNTFVSFIFFNSFLAFNNYSKILYRGSPLQFNRNYTVY